MIIYQMFKDEYVIHNQINTLSFRLHVCDSSIHDMWLCWRGVRSMNHWLNDRIIDWWMIFINTSIPAPIHILPAYMPIKLNTKSRCLRNFIPPAVANDFDFVYLFLMIDEASRRRFDVNTQQTQLNRHRRRNNYVFITFYVCRVFITIRLCSCWENIEVGINT